MARTRNRRRKRKHDASYKKIFAHRGTIGDLLRGFAGKLARHLGFATLERLPASFVTEHLGQRHADMLWKIQTANGSWLYLLVLLEFRSTIDHITQVLARTDAAGRTLELQTRSEEARTMSTLAERVRKWGDELNQQWLEKGERQMVSRLAARRFGPGIAEQLSPLLDKLSDPDSIAAVATMVFECENGADFIARAREV